MTHKPIGATDELNSQQFYHWTKADLKSADLIGPGYSSNYGKRKKAAYVYLTATLEAATWGPSWPWAYRMRHVGYDCMNPTLETSVVSSSPDVMCGAAVFAGTRVPAQNLLDYFAGGHTLEEFLEDFPTVKREQAVGLLKELRHSFDTTLEK